MALAGATNVARLRGSLAYIGREVGTRLREGIRVVQKPCKPGREAPTYLVASGCSEDPMTSGMEALSRLYPWIVLWTYDHETR